MADTIRILGQTLPDARVLTGAYTVPSATSTVISTIHLCNQQAVLTTVRISIAIGNTADAPAQYLYYDLPVQANDSFSMTAGVTLAVTDVVRVYSANGLVSFNIFGVEVT